MAAAGNMTNFPSGFAQGIVVRGLPLQQNHPGKVWWVSNVAASTSGAGPNFKDGSNGNNGSLLRLVL